MACAEPAEGFELVQGIATACEEQIGCLTSTTACLMADGVRSKLKCTVFANAYYPDVNGVLEVTPPAVEDSCTRYCCSSLPFTSSVCIFFSDTFVIDVAGAILGSDS